MSPNFKFPLFVEIKNIFQVDGKATIDIVPHNTR